MLISTAKSLLSVNPCSFLHTISSSMDQVPFLSLQSYHNDYQSISTLGNGSFGTVVLAKYRHPIENLVEWNVNKKGTMLDLLSDSSNHLGPLVAIKTMNKKLTSIEDYARVKEYKFIISIPSHPSLVQIYSMFIDRSYLNLHIVMETMNQNLYQLMKSRKNVKFSSVTLKSILRQLADGIRHIHRHGYFHRDIKPENILVCHTQQYYCSNNNGCKFSNGTVPSSRSRDNFVVKIADYGLARHVNNVKAFTEYVSTRWYRSPEILLRNNGYSKPVDIWAFGAVAVEMATFRPLFPGANELDQIWKVLEILGSPSSDTGSDSEIDVDSNAPFGGFWDEAQSLASNLGFLLPSNPGVTINQILPEESYTDLGELVQKCLTWNPDKRISIEEVCQLAYFRNTSLSGPYVEPSRFFQEDEVADDHQIQNNYSVLDENTDPMPTLDPFYVHASPEKYGRKRDTQLNLQQHSLKNATTDYGPNFMGYRGADFYFTDRNNNGKEREEEDDSVLEGVEEEEEEESVLEDVLEYNGYNEQECNYEDESIQYILSHSKKIGIEYSWETNTKLETPALATSLLLRGELFDTENSDVERTHGQEDELGIGDISIGSIKEISC
ncbi:putative sporulation protein kinase Pit1p [[Candida] railenensis]|uniref:Sporulation protein kinase Pit1p n=1 Tax=[Candida] railenensis TaxID=45579 RepID=A0A9P0QN55_9ASCO|nr:putative sporulation protein kinase Pit1p [[Candida] railenensis]